MRLLLPILFLAAASRLAADVPADARLDALVAEAWDFELHEDPLLATAAGDHRFDDRLPSVAPEALDRRAARRRDLLARLRGIERGSLSPTRRVTHRLLERELEVALAAHAFREWRIPFTSDSGFHTEILRLPREVPLATTTGYENYLARLRTWRRGPPSRATRWRPRSIATSPGPGRPSPTRSASSRSASCERGRRGPSAPASTSGASTTPSSRTAR
jgi:hypothetical protein